MYIFFFFGRRTAGVFEGFLARRDVTEKAPSRRRTRNKCNKKKKKTTSWGLRITCQTQTPSTVLDTPRSREPFHPSTSYAVTSTSSLFLLQVSYQRTSVHAFLKIILLRAASSMTRNRSCCRYTNIHVDWYPISSILYHQNFSLRGNSSGKLVKNI